MWHPISERRRTNLRIMLLPRTAKDFPRSSKSPFDFRKEIRKQPVVKVRFALKECVSLCRLQRFNTSVRPCYRTGTNGPMAMPNPKHVEACFLCRQPFEFGSQVYQGRRIPEWDMMTCTSCYESNRDGLVPKVFPHLIPYLKIARDRNKPNARGRIDWPT